MSRRGPPPRWVIVRPDNLGKLSRCGNHPGTTWEPLGNQFPGGGSRGPLSRSERGAGTTRTERERSQDRREYIKAWKLANRERLRAAENARPPRGKPAEQRLRQRRARIARCRELVIATKLARGCKDCGYNAHAEALDFDHSPGADKRCSVSRLARHGSLELLVAEIAKCEVVCANCHRVRTAVRRDRMP